MAHIISFWEDFIFKVKVCCLKLHWSTKFTLFFVPRTSIGELNNTFYAEFRCVQNFSIRQGFKDTEEFKCAKWYFTCSWNRQKLSSKMLSRMTFASIWHEVHSSSVSSNSLPTYFEVHLPWYRFSIAVMSWWNLSLCLSLTSPGFSGEKSKFKCVSRKWVFRFISHPIALYEVNRSCTTSW
jgi:hypothetical protein